MKKQIKRKRARAGSPKKKRVIVEAPALQPGASSMVVELPVKVKRRAGRTTLTRANRPGTELIRAVSNAHYWLELLEEGKYPSISSLARVLHKDRCYVRRILNLAFLAPDIVEAILDGNEPSGFRIDDLCKLPQEWQKQRQVVHCHGDIKKDVS